MAAGVGDCELDVAAGAGLPTLEKAEHVAAEVDGIAFGTGPNRGDGKVEGVGIVDLDVDAMFWDGLVLEV